MRLKPACVLLLLGCAVRMSCAQSAANPVAMLASRVAPGQKLAARSPEYAAVQRRLAQGWNTWDVYSATTQVLLPEGLAIRAALEHNSSEGGTELLPRLQLEDGQPGSDFQVIPGRHAWDGRYTELTVKWRGSAMRLESAHDGEDLVMLATPLPAKATSALPATLVFAAEYLWDRPGTVEKTAEGLQARDALGTTGIFCVTETGAQGCSDPDVNLPVGGAYFAVDFRSPVGLSTGRPRTLAEIEAAIARGRQAYEDSVAKAGEAAPMLDAMETTMGWDTIYDAENERVISVVTRSWSAHWGGYVLFEWDTFFGASLAAVGDRDLAYANAVEILNEETPAGFVPNYARADRWKSFDRSEPPVGAMTVLSLYRKFHDRWLLEETFAPLLRWNRWWAEHRDVEGYLTWGSDAGNQPRNPDDGSVGTWQGAIYESGLDNSPMYDGTRYDAATGKLEFADVGLMSLYVEDCRALAAIAGILDKPAEQQQLESRAEKYRAKLETMWSEKDGIFLNRNLATGGSSERLSPTNFYPLIARVATAKQAQRMIQEHLLNPKEFWGKWVMPSIARDDPAFEEQVYWRGRIWGPMNYLAYLGLRNYADPAVRKEFAEKSWELFDQEWRANGHVHENYNAITGMGDDVTSSDRFYDWGALLALIEYEELTGK